MKLSFRYAIAAIVMAGALFLLSPTLMPEDVNLPGASRISLGLDLKGGVQLTLGVDTEKAVQSALVNSGQMLRQKAREAGITVLGPRQMPGGVQELIIARANQADARIVIAKGRNLRVYPALFHAVRHANRAEIALLRQQNLRKRIFRHKHAVGVRGAHHADAAL